MINMSLYRVVKKMESSLILFRFSIQISADWHRGKGMCICVISKCIGGLTLMER